MTTHCTQATITGLLALCRERGTAHIERDGKALPKRAQMALLRAAQRKGQVWFPTCVNMDRVGKCMGHEEASHARD